MASILTGGCLCIVVCGVCSGSEASVAYGSIAHERVMNRAERRPVEEALLTFRIEEVREHASLASCAAEQNMKRAQRLLDPQLSTADIRSNFDPINLAKCREIESASPTDR